MHFGPKDVVRACALCLRVFCMKYFEYFDFFLVRFGASVLSPRRLMKNVVSMAMDTLMNVPVFVAPCRPSAYNTGVCRAIIKKKLIAIFRQGVALPGHVCAILVAFSLGKNLFISTGDSPC